MHVLKFDEYKLLVDANSSPLILGEGATATVYLARNTETNLEVALKVFKDELVGKMQAQCCGPLMKAKSQHLIKVYSAKRSSQGPYIIAMERLSGQTLADELAGIGRMEWRRVCLLAAQIATGLVNFSPHVHLDLKPENIFLDIDAGSPDERVVLLDCGSLVRGTLSYSPPEQLIEDHVPDSQNVDVYALGSCMWEMLTGSPPFGRFIDVEDFRAVGEAKLSSELDFGELADVPEAVCDMLRRMLAIQPGERFQHPQEVLAAVHTALEHENLATLAYPQAPSSSSPKFSDAEVCSVDSIIKVRGVTNGVTFYNGKVPRGNHQVGIAQITIPSSAQSECRLMRQEIEDAAQARLLGIREILGTALEDETILNVLTEPWGREDFLNTLLRSEMPNTQRDGLSRGGMDLFLFLSRLVDESERRGWQSLYLSSAVISLPDAKRSGVWYAPGHRVWVPMGNPVNYWSHTAGEGTGGTVTQVNSLKGPLHRQFAALFYEFVGGASPPVSVFSEGGVWTPPVPPKDIRDGNGFCRLLAHVHNGRRDIAGQCEEWMSEIAQMLRPSGAGPKSRNSPKPPRLPEPAFDSTEIRNPAPITIAAVETSSSIVPLPGDAETPAPCDDYSKQGPPQINMAPTTDTAKGPELEPPRRVWAPTPSSTTSVHSSPEVYDDPLDTPSEGTRPDPPQKPQHVLTWVLLAALGITLLLQLDMLKWLFKPTPPQTALLGSISGTVWSDSDGDGKPNVGIQGVRLELKHSDSTPVDKDSATSGVQPTETTSDSSGNYLFDKVPAGDYLIVETQPPGYDSVSDTDGGDNNIHGDNGGLTLIAGDTASGFDFLERPQKAPGYRSPPSQPQPPPATGSISGSVLADTDGDGKVETGSGIDGVNVELLDANGQQLRSKTMQTDARGKYEFKDLTPGDYQIRQIQPSNYTSLPTAGDGGDPNVLGDQRRIVVEASKTTSGQDFHLQAPFTPQPVVTRLELNELHTAATFSQKLRADWIDALAKAVQYGERFKATPGSVPQDLKTYVELLCVRMVEDSTKEGWGAQMPLLRQAAAPPLQSSLALYLLANQHLEDANTLLRATDISAANAQLKQVVDYLDEGIKLGQPLCKGKKGALLTVRMKAYQDNGYQGVIVPGGTPEDGLRLIDEAYKELSLDYLASNYKVSSANLQERSKLFEAQLAYALGLCWQFGLGTGTVPVPPEKSYTSLTLMEKRAFDNACNQFDLAIAKNRKFAPSYGRWLVLQVQGLGALNDEEAWRSRWTSTMKTRAKDGAILDDGYSEYWLARFDWKLNRRNAISLMQKAAQPGKETELDARQWLASEGIK
jgi:serine/threonine protein kinase